MMKYVFAFVGMAIGQIIGDLVADSRATDWTLGIVLGVVGYYLPAFVRYRGSTPKELLAFHGPGAPISRSTSSREIRTFLAQLHEGGLLLDFLPSNDFAKVNDAQWSNLVESERLALAQVLMQAQAVDFGSVGQIRILDHNGTLLARYSATDKTALLSES